MATGCLSQPLEPQIPGRDTFTGLSLFTTRCGPRRSPTSRGKRVGLIGTGSSGVQATPVIADEADHLYVFQRTPVVRVAGRQQAARPRPAADGEGAVPRAPREQQRKTFGGVVGTSGAIAVPLPRDVAILDATEEERVAAVDELGWAACRAWSDVLRDYEANELGAELYREMIRRDRQRSRDRGRRSRRATTHRMQAADPRTPTTTRPSTATT